MNDLSPFGSGSILERAGATVTLTSLQLSDPDVPYETLQELLAFAGTVHKASSWWIGDTLNQIEGRYGDKVYQAATVLDLSESTVMNIMSTCKLVPRSRRREAVKFWHHAEVKALPPEEQTKWLREAEEKEWTKADLRREIQGKPQPAVEVECHCPVCGNRHNPQDAMS